APTQQAFNNVLESTLPTVDSGNQAAALGMMTAMFDLAGGQLSDVNTGGGETGLGTGNNMGGLHFWAQGFGSKSNQDDVDGVAGYDARILGLGIGVDTRNYHQDTVIGFSFGKANTNVDSQNVNRTDTDVDSYQFMVYGSTDLGGNSFLTGMAAYGWNGNDQ